MLNCTWDDMEHEMALRRLGEHLNEQQKAERDYLKLRELFRNGNLPPTEVDPPDSQ